MRPRSLETGRVDSLVFILAVEAFIVISVAISTLLDAMVLVLLFRVLRQLDVMSERSNHQFDVMTERNSHDTLALFGLEEAVKDMRHRLGAIFDAKYGR